MTTPIFTNDGFGDQAKIGLVYMASSVVMEPEMYAMAGPGVSIHTSRLRLRKVTVSGIDDMMRSPELEESVRLLAEAPLDVICFGGTSASFLHGTSWDRALVEKIASWAPGIPATTTSSGVLGALDAVGATTVAMATPYVDEINQRAVRFLGENGYQVVSHQGLGITSDHELAEVPLERVFDLATAVDDPRASAIFISCTNLRTVGAIAALEEELGKPVVSAVQAAFWHCLTSVGVKGARPGYGVLLDRLSGV